MGTNPVMPRPGDESASEDEESEDAEEKRLIQRELSIAWVPPSKDIANFAFVRQHYHHEVGCNSMLVSHGYTILLVLHYALILVTLGFIST